MLTSFLLKDILPQVTEKALSVYVPLLNMYMPRYNIDTPERIGAFIAFAAADSGNFKFTKEHISGIIYEGRRELGNDVMGDGQRYKGGGLIKIRGKELYRQLSMELYGSERLLDTPGLLAAPGPATRSACWLWDKIKIANAIADLPETWHHGDHNKLELMAMTVFGSDILFERLEENYIRARMILRF